MSINVTVSGNPVSIKKGRMVTADPNYAKKEFNKRRLLRLEQVRQQSKDIAEDVRNKVRQEKKKQAYEIEEEGRQKMKNWQTRKLLDLQTQYKEALQELGAGHKEAQALVDETEVMAERKQQNEKLACDRGRVAASKLQIERNKANFKKSIPIQQKKLVRDIENTRAALVSNIKKKKTTIRNSNKKKRKKVSADINITIPQTDSESEESGESSEEDTSEDKTAEAQHVLSSSYTEESENNRTSSNSNDTGSNQHKQDLQQDAMIQTMPPGPKPSLNIRSPIERSKVPYKSTREESRNDIHTLDTRISDRIKRREIMASQPDYCDIVAETNPSPFIKSNTKIREAIESRYNNQGLNGTNNICTCGKNQATCSLSCGREAREPGPSNTCTCRKNPSKCLCGQRPEVISPDNRYTYEKNERRDSLSSDQELKENNPSNRYTHRKNERKYSLPTNQRQKERKQSASSPRRKSGDSNVGEEIPTKPPVRLKDSRFRGGKGVPPSRTRTTLDSSDSHKVQYYDHANGFSQDKLSNSHVEKITTHSIEVLPNETSEVEWYEKMRQRDREAQMRGKRALEKEKVHKDYEQIVTKLPLLQKRERITEINKDKPEFHMTGDRLKERERRRQNQLDNAYTKLFPNLKPALITLPRNKHDPETRMAPGDDEVTQSLNVAKWDVDHEEPKMFTIDEVQEIIKVFTGQKPKDRRAKLKDLLGDLKLQKEQLLKEIQCLPRDKSINDLINDLNSVSDSCRPRKRDKTCNRKRCHEENEKETSPDSTTESSSSVVPDLKHHRRRKSRLNRGENGKTPSPRKKAKMKSKRAVLILQNTSTQTTPKVVDPSTSPPRGKPTGPEDPRKRSEVPSPLRICDKMHIPCDCNKENINSAEELCQILIKLNDNEEPEVVVKAKEREHQILDGTSKTKQKSPSAKKIETKIESKSIAIGTDDIIMINEKETVEKKRKSSKVSPSSSIEQSKKETGSFKLSNEETKREQPPSKERSDPKAKSWREQLSKNSMSSTSTSYLSPPNFQAAADQTLSSHVESMKPSFYDLHKKPQQGNLCDLSCLSVSQNQSLIGERNIDPCLLSHIKKLLSMSRDSVDNLSVSTSNVQTPSQSVVEMDSNNPLAQLHNLIKYFNLKAEDIARELSYSPDASTAPYNSSSSTSEKSMRQQKAGEKNKGKHVSIDSPKSDISEKQSSAHTPQSTQSLLDQYTNVTDSCSKRIANLASMIQQIREEKIEMLQHPLGSEVEQKSVGASQASSEQDGSTGYLDLPGSIPSSLHSSDDEEIQKRLLEIDLILANKLRKFTPLGENPIIEEDENRKDIAGPSKVSGSSKEVSDEATNELWIRLKRLTQTEAGQPSTSATSSRDNDPPFISFLSDIPKLPKLEAQPEGKFDSYQRRPPPSKGLTIAKKFNGNISLVPHELSTIAEADSQISTKISSTAASPNSSRVSLIVSPRKGPKYFEQRIRHENLSSTKSSKSSSDKSPITTGTSCLCERDTDLDLTQSSKSGSLSQYADVSSKSKASGEGSLSRSLTTMSKKSVLVSSSSSDDLETIEAMLKSIGMEWAIPTLHKTNEALALASSSSSQDVSGKVKSKGHDTTGSEISLKDFLSKQMVNRVSSSSLTSEVSPVSLSVEFSDMSAIQFTSTENNGKRTSTPITSSNSKSKSTSAPVAFSNASDISSVNAYDNPSFHSLSEWSHFKNG